MHMATQAHRQCSVWSSMAALSIVLTKTEQLQSGGDSMAKKADTNDTLQQLKTQLKQKKLGRAFVFHGEETFLLRYYLE